MCVYEKQCGFKAQWADSTRPSTAFSPSITLWSLFAKFFFFWIFPVFFFHFFLTIFPSSLLYAYFLFLQSLIPTFSWMGL